MTDECNMNSFVTDPTEQDMCMGAFTTEIGGES